MYSGFYSSLRLMWRKQHIIRTGFSKSPGKTGFLKLVPEHTPHGSKICLHDIALVCLMKQLSVDMCMVLHHTKHTNN